MKLLKVSLCAVAASMAMAGAAAAQEITFNAGVTNAYVFRGVKQSVDAFNSSTPAVFGGADVTFAEDFYAGIWTSQTGSTFFSRGGLETDVYAGWKPSLGPVDLDLGVIFYAYNKAAGGSGANTTEWKVAGSLPVGEGSVGLAYYYTDDIASSGDNFSYTELTGSFPVGDRFTVSGGWGFARSNFIGGNDRYQTYNLGVTVPVTMKVSLDARYIGTDSDAVTNLGTLAAGDTFVATIKATF